jgi:hypothetical protein
MNIDHPATTPAERLAASRERLRQVLQLGATGAAGGDPASSLGGLAFDWFEAVAGAGKAQPLRLAAALVLASLRPLAQERPRTLVAVAALLGAGVMAWRPWRGVLRPALLAGLLPVAAKWLLRRPA